MYMVHFDVESTLPVVRIFNSTFRRTTIVLGSFYYWIFGCVNNVTITYSVYVVCYV